MTTEPMPDAVARLAELRRVRAELDTERRARLELDRITRRRQAEEIIVATLEERIGRSLPHAADEIVARLAKAGLLTGVDR